MATLYSVSASILMSLKQTWSLFDILASQLNRFQTADKIIHLVDFNTRLVTNKDVWRGVMGRHLINCVVIKV